MVFVYFTNFHLVFAPSRLQVCFLSLSHSLSPSHYKVTHAVAFRHTLPLFGSLSFFSLAGSRLQHRLELPGHADVILLLTDHALDGGREASGVPGEDEGITVLTAAILLLGAAGVGDGIVVIVGVNHPVVVTW